MNGLVMKTVGLLKNLLGVQWTTRGLCLSVSRYQGGHESPTTGELRDRLTQIVVDTTLDEKQVHVPSVQTDLPPRRMIDSVQTAIIPLSSDEALRKSYRNFMGGTRFGKILHDLDTFAVWLSYTHNNILWADGGKAPYSIYTALVDKIAIQDTSGLATAEQDLKLIGNVTWVGQSSMETSMKLQRLDEEQWKTVLAAKFVMVSRNPYNHKPAAVCPLVAETDLEKEIIAEGEKAKTLRRKEAQRSVLKTAPDAEETDIVHELFKHTLDLTSGSFRNRLIPEGHVWMEDATLKTISITQPEVGNLYKKVFGGYLMQKGFELAWANACMYIKSRPILEVIDDIFFLSPVEIGSVLLLSSQVVYTDGNRLQVRVYAESMSPIDGTRQVTNTLQVTFRGQNVPTVMPKTYGEAMLYIDGRRHFKDCIIGIDP